MDCSILRNAISIPIEYTGAILLGNNWTLKEKQTQMPLTGKAFIARTTGPSTIWSNLYIAK